MISLENIASHELIGQYTEIVKSSNQFMVGFNGTIVDETKNMFTVKANNTTKKIPKAINSWKFVINGNEKIIEGTKITKRPFDRIGVRL